MTDASHYKISVRVEITRRQDEATDGPQRSAEGGFEQVISPEQAGSIDACEQALVQTTWAAVRDGLGAHLSAISREHAVALAGSPEACEIRPYRVEGESGRIVFASYWVREAAGGAAATCLFAPLGPREWRRTTGFQELALVYGVCEESYRKACDLVNRVHSPLPPRINATASRCSRS